MAAVGLGEISVGAFLCRPFSCWNSVLLFLIRSFEK